MDLTEFIYDCVLCLFWFYLLPMLIVITRNEIVKDDQNIDNPLTNILIMYNNIKNLFLGLKEQGPLKRAFRNFFITGNAWGLFSKYSHIRKDGVPKISYRHKETAIKAAQKMGKKNGVHYSVYKCIYCDGYHIGRNRDNK